ncbi:MAG: MltA domain-containing protein [Ancalomicrobiaceae bacterium]|nr:MltA domain-containing protein [Ancalomicrobiaceae bacterium]
MAAVTTKALGAAPERAVRRVPLDFLDLEGWSEDAHDLAFAAFARSCRQSLLSTSAAPAGLRRVAELAGAEGLLDVARLDRTRCRSFFEAHFRPVRIEPPTGQGFLTGYFEPEVEGSRVPTGRFRYPLYARPADLVDVDPSAMPAGWEPDRRFGRATAGEIVPYFDRAAIEAGALDGRGLELVYLEDPIEAYVIHVQGSARIRLAEGGLMRVAYAAKAGHPYTSLGRLLIERGVASAETMTLEVLANWLRTAGDAGRALMRKNRSYIFFHELEDAGLDPDLGAIGAAGVQLTPGRSIAVDAREMAYGWPVWIAAWLPTGQDGAIEPFRRLMVAQDTGSAIVGPARADLFMGLGPTAGTVAGRIRHAAEVFVVLEPAAGDLP